MSKKRVKKRKKIGIIIFCMALVILFILIYCVPNVGETFQKTRIATYDSIQILDNLEGFVVRDETVYFSNVSGMIHYNTSEGVRVRKGSEVLSVNIQNIDPKAESKLEVINQRIQRISNGESIFENDLEKIEALIQSYIDDIRKAKEEGNLSEIRKIEEKITRLIDKKNIIINNTGLENSNIEALEQERVELESEINQSLISFNSPNTGLVSYCIDGYESQFTPLNMYLLKKEELEQIDFEVQNTYREETLANEPLYKIVNTSTWYIAAWIESDKIDQYIKGNTVYLNLPNGQTQGIIYDMIKDDSGNLVLIEVDSYYPEYWKLREINTQIIVANYEGLKIDDDSIVEKDGQKGVFVVDIDGEYIFRPIKIIGSNAGKTIVESGFYYTETKEGLKKVKTIDLYDEILRNAEKIL